MNPIPPAAGTGPMTRREALKRVAAASLLAGTFGGCAGHHTAAASQAGFRFLVVNDTHYLTQECGKYLQGLVRQMRTEGAALCLHAGDLTDQGQPPHLAAVRDIFAGLGRPFYPVIGNHDYATQTDCTGYTAAFPDRLNYTFTHQGWQFIALDTSEGQHYEKTRIAPATFAALDGFLARLDLAQPTIVFTHFPLCESVKMRPLNAEDLLAKLKGLNLHAVYSGHYHGFTECTRGQAALTTNRCCAFKRNNHDGSKEKGYFVCTVSGSTLTRKFVEYKPA